MRTDLIDKQIEWIEKRIKAPNGQPWSLEGREWVRTEIIEPISGFHLWANDTDYLCAGCKHQAGTVISYYWDFEEANDTDEHRGSDSCKGLQAIPIIVTIAHVRRQGGKSVGISGVVFEKMFNGVRESISMIAGSEDQGEGLLIQLYSKQILDSESMLERVKLRSTSFEVPEQKNLFEVLPTSSTVAGRTRTMIIVEEARDVPPKVFMSLFPVLNACNGWTCPANPRHVKTWGDADSDPTTPNCTICGDRLVPWYSRAVIASSSGELKDETVDWFAQLVEEITAVPDPRFHLFSTSRRINPNISKHVDGTMDVWAKLPATRHLADVEGENQFRSRGEEFLTKVQIAQVVHQDLINYNAYDRPCVGFLDASTSRDLTSLVITADDSDEGTPAWSKLRVVHIKTWDPAKLPGGVIDDRAIGDYMLSVLPGFLLVKLGVDTRLVAWPKLLVHRLKSEGLHYVYGVNWNTAERSAQWSSFESHVLSKTIALPDNKTLISELRSARRKIDINNRMQVIDANRRIRHLDIADSAAATCYIAHQQAARSGQSLSEIGGPNLSQRFIGRRLTAGIRNDRF